jgi:hypothetical protein
VGSFTGELVDMSGTESQPAVTLSEE